MFVMQVVIDNHLNFDKTVVKSQSLWLKVG